MCVGGGGGGVGAIVYVWWCVCGWGGGGHSREVRDIRLGAQPKITLIKCSAGSVLGPLLFLVYINDLTDKISSQTRLFADDSSLFTCVEGVHQTQDKLVNDLKTVTSWAYQWKMVFNPDISKQASEVIFSVKKKKPEHPDLVLTGVPLARLEHTEHLGSLPR